MELIYKKREKAVGALLVAVAALLLFMVVLIGRSKDWFETYIIYYTFFNQGYNLQEDAAVKLSKAQIGRVRKITLSEDKVRVELAILEEYTSKVRADSIATVESPTLIGDEYVSIKLGSNYARQLKSGDIIPSKEKKSLDDYLEELEIEKTSKMLIGAIQNLSEVVKNLRDPKGPLFATLNNFSKIVEELQEGKGTVGGILKSEETLDKIDAILENVKLTTEKTPDTVDKVNENLAELKILINGVKENVAILKKTLKNIEKGSEEVPQVTYTTRKGIQEIRDAVVNIDNVVQSIQKNAFIRSKLPPEPEGENIDAGLR